MLQSVKLGTIALLMGMAIVSQSCGEEPCVQGQPQAIFSEQTPGVVSHVFSLGEDRQSAEESLVLTSGEQLTIVQQGCTELVQEYRFVVTDTITEIQRNDPYFWIATLLKRLDQLRELGAEYGQYGQYVQAIAAKAEDWQLGETYELAPGFYARIDIVTAQRSNILLLILSDRP